MTVIANLSAARIETHRPWRMTPGAAARRRRRRPAPKDPTQERARTPQRTLPSPVAATLALSHLDNLNVDGLMAGLLWEQLDLLSPRGRALMGR